MVKQLADIPMDMKNDEGVVMMKNSKFPMSFLRTASLLLANVTWRVGQRIGSGAVITAGGDQ